MNKKRKEKKETLLFWDIQFTIEYTYYNIHYARVYKGLNIIKMHWFSLERRCISINQK